MDRTVANAAMNLQSMAGRRPEERGRLRGGLRRDPDASITKAPTPVPDYMSALRLDFVDGQAHRLQRHLRRGHAREARLRRARGRRRDHGPAAADRRRPVPGLPAGYQQHKAIDEYYKNLGPYAPIKTLVEEVADNQANEHQALKFGNNHLNASLSDVTPGGANETAYRDGDADPARGAVEGHRRHDEQRDAGRPERRLPRDPRHRPERRDRRHAADHDPDGLQRHAAARASACRSTATRSASAT